MSLELFDYDNLEAVPTEIIEAAVAQMEDILDDPDLDDQEAQNLINRITRCERVLGQREMTLALLSAVSNQPYRCPVCKGRCTLHDPHTDNDYPCHECGGAGWVE